MSSSFVFRFKLIKLIEQFSFLFFGCIHSLMVEIEMNELIVHTRFIEFYLSNKKPSTLLDKRVFN